MKRKKKFTKAGRPAIAGIVRVAALIMKDHHNYLRNRAFLEGKSMSEILREILEKEMS